MPSHLAPARRAPRRRAMVGLLVAAALFAFGLGVPGTSAVDPAPSLPKVGLIASENTGQVENAASFLRGTGRFASATVLVTGDTVCVGGTPSPPTLETMQEYDVLFLWTRCSWGSNYGNALGDGLADYVDGGGRLVVSSPAAVSAPVVGIGGRFRSGGYLPVSLGAAPNLPGLTVVPVIPGHPLLSGVTGLTSTGPIHTSNVVAGATNIANWSNGRPLLTVKDRVTFVNLLPVGLSPAGVTLFANAVANSAPPDTTAPTVTATPNPAMNANGWSASPTVVNLSASDGGSGVQSVTYSATGAQTIASTTVTGSSAAFTVSANGVTTVTYRATDNAGNTSANQALVVRVDTVLPTLTSSGASTAWLSTPQTFNWTASDTPSGIDGPTSFQTVLASEGAAQQSFASTKDRAGNQVTAASQPVSLDFTKPVTQVTVSGNGLDPWYRSLPVPVTVTGSDNLSGILKFEYFLDGVPGFIFGPSGVVNITTEGRHVLRVGASDNANNREADRTFTINVDLGAPAIATVIDPAPSGAWSQAPVNVTATCTDPNLANGEPGSGLTQCSVDGAPSHASGAGLVSSAGRSAEGRHVLPVTAGDAAGNTSSVGISANIDRTAPHVVASPDRAADHVGHDGLRWYQGPVTVGFACTDPDLAPGVDGSGVAACADPVELAADGAGQSASGQGSDLAGNEAETTLADVNVDATAPAVTWTVNGSTELQPWYSGDVTVAFSCTDATSGVLTCPAPIVLSDEGSGQVAVGTAYDDAGNATVVQVAGIDIDRTNPYLTATLDPAPAGAWSTTAVTVRWACTDPDLLDGSPGSGVASCPADQVVTTDGLGQVLTATATDRAGNTGQGTATVNVDATGPTISGAPTTAANGAGWHRGDVTVAWTVADATSGIDEATVPAESNVTGEGADLSASASVADVAGNTSSATVSPIKIDRTAPRTALAAEPPTWANDSVMLALVASDALSGVAATSWSVDGGASQAGTDVVITSEGRHTLRFSSVDAAGNEEAPVTVAVDIDRSAPTISATQAPVANAAGWNNGTVTVTFTCLDPDLADASAGSGIADCTAPVTASTEGAGQAVAGSARDTAGNGAVASASVSIDVTSPTVHGAVTSAPNGKGWYRTPVAVAFTCHDALSGVVSCGSQRVLATDGAGLVATSTAVDAAENTGTGSVGGIDLDQTPPSITGAPTTAPDGTGGWYRSAVTVGFTVADAGSGIDGAGPAAVVLHEGADQVVSASVADNAGNSASATVDGIDVDGTAPAVVASLSVPVPNGAHGWWTTPVTVTFTCTDATSGVVSCPADQVLGGGIHAAQQLTVSDAAGNTTTVSVPEIKVDADAPTVTFAGNAGTYDINDTVTITCTAADATSGVDVAASSCPSVSAPASSFLVGEGAENVLRASVTDAAGRTTTVATSFTVSGSCGSLADLTAAYSSKPAITLVLVALVEQMCSAPTAFHKALAAGLYSVIVRVSTPYAFTAAEAGELTRFAGMINARPTVAVLQQPSAPNANGWYSTAVSVQFLCTDATSGIAPGSCPASQSLGHGHHAAQSFTVRNVAGKATTAAVPVIDVDTVDPTVVLAGNAGTYTVDQTVTITCTATDALSGIDAAHTRCATTTVPAYEGTSVVASARDRAGNLTTATARYTVVVTCPSLRTLTASLVSSAAAGAAMDTALAAACSATTTKARKQALESYTKAVKAQSGKGLTRAEADLLLDLVGQL